MSGESQIKFNFHEILFEFLKHLPTQEKVLEKILIEKVEKVNGTQNGLKRKPIQESRNNIVAEIPENLLYNRILMKKTKLQRTLFIDLVNVYDINSVTLNFEKSQKKVPMVIHLSISSSKNEWNEIESFYYPEHVFEQLSICSFSEEMEKNIRNASKQKFNCLSLPLSQKFKARYVKIDIFFKSLPAMPSAKDLERVPQSEIIPEIFGLYAGE